MSPRSRVQGVSTPNLVLGDLVSDVAQNVMTIMISRPSRGQWVDSVRPYMGVVIWYKRHGLLNNLGNVPVSSFGPRLVATHADGILLTETYARQEIGPDGLTLDQDRGSPMRSKTFAQTCADLGVTKNFSRSPVLNDNPFSKAQLETLKYRPAYHSLPRPTPRRKPQP